MQALLIFPHQLFASNAKLAKSVGKAILIEDALFFLQFRFHKQKLVLHRASMQSHADYLRSLGVAVEYVAFAAFPTLLDLFKHLSKSQIDGVHCIDVIDDWLERRLKRAAFKCSIALTWHESEMFLSQKGLLQSHFFAAAEPRMAPFYKDQRRQNDILMSADGPVGDRWSFDADNRKKLPRDHLVPVSLNAHQDRYVEEAKRYVDTHFAHNPGSVDPFFFPIDHTQAQSGLDDFVFNRLTQFGVYEDAISVKHDVLFHSLLSPSLNIGLLTPRQVIDAALSRTDSIPLNSLEGFVRQIIGWREYMRGVYLSKGRRQRTRNFWKHSRSIPAAFWRGGTGVAPLDMVIEKVLRCAYAHHIERLMVAANFMQLCEFDPDQVYQWFMELFIDSYDWVMVPNVYGMALYADGGGTTTKPYISGSNYLLKMSDIPKGPWCATWDGLYWRFVAKHRDFFSANHRTRVLVQGLDRMSAAKRTQHLETAENFLNDLHP